MSTAVLATKLFVPARSRRVVARSRLADKLESALVDGHRLTLISAPAGFGKTTLLSDWIASLGWRPGGVGVGWLSLDADDNDPHRLLTHMTAALIRAGLPIDATVLDLGPGTSTDTLTSLINEIVRVDEASSVGHWVLVLDDYHVVEAPVAHEAVAFLLDHLPPSVHLIMGTRSDPPLPLARLRSRWQLTELRAADLRFTAAEARDLLNDVMGLELTDDDVATLEQRTEGWVAGLQLAALSLRDIADRSAVEAFIDHFAGSNRFVVDYLVEEVLARQTDEIRDFLLRTSILDQLSGGLCNAVLGGEGGGRVLEELERGDLFVVPLDHQRGWYRYHHLFADALGARLLAEHAGEAPDLHRRASAWYVAHDLTIHGVRHALAAEDFGRAARLIEGELPDLRRARQDGLLLTWMQSLPESVVRRSPVLSIWTAWSQLMSSDLDAMEQWLRAAEAALAAGAHDPVLSQEWADTEDLRIAPATISIYRASLAQARGDVAGTVRHARQALHLAGPEDHLIRGQGGAFLALAAWADGRIPEALATFSAAVRDLHAAGNLVDELDATIVLADMWVALGRPGRARELYERSLQQATANGEPYPRATADLHVGLAELDRELDDLPSARHHLETAHELAQHASITENRHRWYVAMAQVCAVDGDHVEATRLLGRAEALYRPGFYPEIRPIPAARARMAIAAGDLTSASEWAQRRGLSVGDDPDYLHEYEHLTLVRLLLAQHRAGRATGGDPGDAPPAVAALALLDRLHAAAADAERHGSLVEIRALQALALHTLGDEPPALGALAQAVEATPEPDGHVRLYLDEGTPMLDLLHRAVTEQRVALPPRLELALRRAEPPGKGFQPRQSLTDPLSQRELDVLRLLDSELTGPNIARQLYVSLNTLRTHTRRIFTKLDVNSRTAAVRRARELDLL